MHRPALPPAELRRATLTAASVLTLGALAHVYLHMRAGLSFPVPWPDELHFALPARALAQHGSLHAPQLHPERALMWMPPGYAFITAPIHLTFSQPFVALRALSLAAALACAALLWRLLAGSRPTAASTIIGATASSAWLMHPSVLASGNVARMDMCLIALVLGGFVALQHDRPWWSLVVFGLAPLVHPNGLYFLCAAGGWHFLRRRRQDLPAPLRPTTTQYLAMGFVVLAWLGYALHVATNWDAFLSDMGAQLQRKASRNLLTSLRGPQGLRLIAFPIVWITCTQLTRARASFTRLPWVFALAAWSVARIGHEMWYEPFDALVMVTLLALATEGLWGFEHIEPATRRRPLVALGIVALVLVLLSLGKDLPTRPSRLAWKRMSLPSVAYVRGDSPSEVQRVADALRASAPGPVEFFPRGDALLFVGQPELSFVDPARFDFGKVPIVLHNSPALPRHWQKRVRRALEDAREQQRDLRLLYARDDDNQWWLVYPRSGP